MQDQHLKHVVMFSGGIGSWAAAKRVAEQHGTTNMVLLFADVKGNATSPHIGEDEDTYRFINDAAANIGAELVTVVDGRDIWEVFKDKRFLGNSRLANCSHLLKQKPAREWLETNCAPEDTIVYVGIDWAEIHRLPAIQRNYQPWNAQAPLTEAPYLSKLDMIAWAKREGLKPPRLYDLGFPHNNCGGGCVRAGQGQFKKLYELMPERYAMWEAKEQELREYLNKDVAILRETVNGVPRPLPLTVLRERMETQCAPVDALDLGGCGCFFESTEEQA